MACCAAVAARASATERGRRRGIWVMAARHSTPFSERRREGIVRDSRSLWCQFRTCGCARGARRPKGINNTPTQRVGFLFLDRDKTGIATAEPGVAGCGLAAGQWQGQPEGRPQMLPSTRLEAAVDVPHFWASIMGDLSMPRNYKVTWRLVNQDAIELCRPDVLRVRSVSFYSQLRDKCGIDHEKEWPANATGNFQGKRSGVDDQLGYKMRSHLSLAAWCQVPVRHPKQFFGPANIKPSPGRVLRASPRCNHGPGGVNKWGRSSTRSTSFASSRLSLGRNNGPEKGVMSDQRNGIVASRREYVIAVSLVEKGVCHHTVTGSKGSLFGFRNRMRGFNVRVHGRVGSLRQSSSIDFRWALPAVVDSLEVPRVFTSSILFDRNQHQPMDTPAAMVTARVTARESARYKDNARKRDLRKIILLDWRAKG
ncbi:hypothetical protein BJ912DRAFT_1132291 [Pholiota molesta]|nr:hypothetical protein BJ912DRAFT_1132291 [Pholiota molesta]